MPSAKLDPSARLNLIPGDTPVQRHTENAETQYFYLLDLRFEVVLLETLSRESIDFKWPILLVVQPDLLMAKFTIMEKDVRSYFQDADTGRIVVSRRSVDETAIVKLLRDQLLRSDVKLEPLDINRGVKALWAQGYIDSQETRFKKPRSTSNETMDERYFLKRDVPEVYAAVRRAPILKAQFQFMRDQEQFVLRTSLSRRVVGYCDSRCMAIDARARSMLLQKFLNLIDATPIGRVVAKREELIEQLDPERIYIENVRSFFGISYSLARLLCEMAVESNYLSAAMGLCVLTATE